MNRTTSVGTPASMSWKRWLLFLLVVAPGVVGAQATIGEMRRQATRSELERAVKAAETASAQAPDEKTRKRLLADAQAIRNRLENGDFIPGDRILLLVQGDTALSDTFTVRGDRVLPLPNVPPISLQGVLDSELEPYLRKELLKYIKDVTLDATPLIRISLVGFPKSDFYTVPVDQAITDVISGAGGWGSTAAVDYNKATIKRNGQVYMDAKSTADAVRQNKTVGDMGLRDGDEFYVPDKTAGGTKIQTVMQVAAGLASLFWIVRTSVR